MMYADILENPENRPELAIFKCPYKFSYVDLATDQGIILYGIRLPVDRKILREVTNMFCKG